MAQAEQLLAEYIQRLQNIQPFNIYKIDDDTGAVAPWFEVTAEVVHDLVLREQGLGYQVQIIAGEIQKWNRLMAQCQRVWQIEERKYRIWRDGLYLAAIDPDDKPAGWKKPPESALAAQARVHPEYGRYYQAIERAEEAYNACKAVVEGFRAKKDMMKSYVVRYYDDAAPQLRV